METFCSAKQFVEHPNFEAARLEASKTLDLREIDVPILHLISQFAQLPYCFTLQSCYGHFQCKPDDSAHNLDPIPHIHDGEVRYRIAYIALCIDNSERGRVFREILSSVTKIDPDYVQFGSATWFWDQCVNSYVLQVEPTAFQFMDVALLDAHEARHVENTRNRFFTELENRVSAAIP